MKKSAVKKTAAVKKSAAAKKTAAKKPKGRALEGKITSWNPASGRGTVKLAKRADDVPFDLMQTQVTNKGYVDLSVGRAVEVTPSPGDDDAFESLTALDEPTTE